MFIYTTYFANLKKLPPHVVPFNIATRQPAGCNLKSIEMFFPKNDFLFAYKAGEINAFEYSKRYIREVIQKIDISQFFDIVMELGKNNQRAALVCYEAPDKFCHRHIVKMYINSLGTVCTCFEYGSVDHQIFEQF